MKNIFLILAALAGVAFGQLTEAEAEAKFYADYAESEKKAVALYPDAMDANSAMSKRISEIDTAWGEAEDPRYYSENKPLILCLIVAKELGIAPVSNEKPQDQARQSYRNQQGKAAAFEAWIAQGGILPGAESKGRGGRKPGVFYQGPMKGMTMAQAKQHFEGMWESTPESVKEKYRKRTDSGELPSQPTAAPRVVDTSEIDRSLDQIRHQQQDAERKRQEMEWQAQRELREIQRQQEELERKQREIERQLRE